MRDEAEMVMVEEHYSTTIERMIGIRMVLLQGDRIDGATPVFKLAEIIEHTARWAEKNGHPKVSGRVPIFFKRFDASEYDTCDEGDTEIARVSRSFADAFKSMRTKYLALSRDGAVRYLVDPVKRKRYLMYLDMIGVEAD